MSVNPTVQLLQDLLRNARTGQEAVEELLPMVEDRDMRSELARERGLYQAARREAEQALDAAGGEPEPTGLLARAGMWLGLQANTFTDRSSAHIAEIVIQGATMGSIEMTKSKNTYAEAEPGALGLASRFIVQQSEIVERQKAFLRDVVHA